MTGVFSGGLVYEFTQKIDDFGLVDVQTNCSANILPEYDTLQSQYKAAPVPVIPSNQQNPTRPTTCASTFANINGTSDLPDQLDTIKALIDNGVPAGNWTKGKFLDISTLNLASTCQIFDSKGAEITSKTIGQNASTTESSQGGATSHKNAGARDAQFTFGIGSMIAIVALIGLIL